MLLRLSAAYLVYDPGKFIDKRAQQSLMWYWLIYICVRVWVGVCVISKYSVLPSLSVLWYGLYGYIYKTDKIKEKQQVGIEFPNFRRLPSSGVCFLQLNVGKNTVHTTILKIPGD